MLTRGCRLSSTSVEAFCEPRNTFPFLFHVFYTAGACNVPYRPPTEYSSTDSMLLNKVDDVLCLFNSECFSTESTYVRQRRRTCNKHAFLTHPTGIPSCDFPMSGLTFSWPGLCWYPFLLAETDAETATIWSGDSLPPVHHRRLTSTEPALEADDDRGLWVKENEPRSVFFVMYIPYDLFCHLQIWDIYIYIYIHLFIYNI